MEIIDITQQLVAWSNGNKEALDNIFPVIHNELYKLAIGRLRNERLNHSLQATALVNEAYIKLVNLKNVSWQNRIQFFAIAAQIMRNILVDYARNQKAEKRGGQQQKIAIEEIAHYLTETDLDLIALDDALKRLETLDERQSRIVEMRYFAGLTLEEIAEQLGISTGTVKREWIMARIWLHKQLQSHK